MARQAGDLQALAFAANGLGHCALHQGDFHLAQSLLSEALKLVRALEEIDGAVVVLTALGQLAAGQGDDEAARARLQEAIDLVERNGSRPVDAVPPLVFLARLANAAGDAAEAERLLADADERLDQAGLRVSPLLLEAKARVVAATGDLVHAKGLLTEAAEACRTGGDLRPLPTILHSAAELSRAQNDLDAATSLHHEALALRARNGDKPGLADSMEAVAGLATESERFEYAARLFAAAQSLRDTYGYARKRDPQQRYEADMARTRSGAEPEMCAKWWSEGERLSLDAAVAYASRRRGARPTSESGQESLSGIEREVASLAAEGLTNPEIGEQLVMSVNTVKTHLKAVFQKLEVRSRRELRELAQRDAIQP